jgi:hypothetical protein
VEGAFSSPEAAMAARPDLQWEPADEEGFPDGFWYGVQGLDVSRVCCLTVDAADWRTRLSQERERMAAEPAPPEANAHAFKGDDS